MQPYYTSNTPSKTKRWYSHEIQNAFVNLTHKDVPKEIRALLSFGPNFAPELPGDNFGDINDIISLAIGDSTNVMDPPSSYALGDKIEKLNSLLSYLENKPPVSKDSKHEYYVEYINKARVKLEKFIQKHPNLLIMNADKGNITILIDKTTYLRKIDEFLNTGINKGTFIKHNESFLGQRLKALIKNKIRNNTSVIQNYETTKKAFLKLTRDSHKKILPYKQYMDRRKDIILRTKELYRNSLMLRNLLKNTINIDTTNIPRMYGLIKIHKTNHPLRPIVDTRNSIVGPIASFISKILTPYKNNFFNIKNTDNLIGKLSRLNLEEFYNKDSIILASLDVKDMFTNIPTVAATNFVITKFGKCIEKRWHIKGDELKNIMLFTMKELNFFQRNGQIFKQTGGLAMGSPLAPIMADLYMDHLFETCMKEMMNYGVVWIHKYVDLHQIRNYKELRTSGKYSEGRKNYLSRSWDH
ncbi:unnamed protein product [Hermetia illucens]|uniref:Reverse transcriptase domain-containing protein n=1 Tax=Hermetia illucens TaxID=343691 RepID=A0A7R8YMM4_HERIL|nr:unnamed protein product [Hermetia illucens]